MVCAPDLQLGDPWFKILLTCEPSYRSLCLLGLCYGVHSLLYFRSSSQLPASLPVDLHVASTWTLLHGWCNVDAAMRPIPPSYHPSSLIWSHHFGAIVLVKYVLVCPHNAWLPIVAIADHTRFKHLHLFLSLCISMHTWRHCMYQFWGIFSNPYPTRAFSIPTPSPRGSTYILFLKWSNVLS